MTAALDFALLLAYCAAVAILVGTGLALLLAPETVLTNAARWNPALGRRPVLRHVFAPRLGDRERRVWARVGGAASVFLGLLLAYSAWAR